MLKFQLITLWIAVGTLLGIQSFGGNDNAKHITEILRDLEQGQNKIFDYLRYRDNGH